MILARVVLCAGSHHTRREPQRTAMARSRPRPSPIRRALYGPETAPGQSRPERVVVLPRFRGGTLKKGGNGKAVYPPPRKTSGLEGPEKEESHRHAPADHGKEPDVKPHLALRQQVWRAEQESQGNEGQEHLSHIHVAVAEPVAKALEELDLGVDALGVGAGDAVAVVAEQLGLPGVEGTAPADQLPAWGSDLPGGGFCDGGVPVRSAGPRPPCGWLPG